jgi:hypothetical protein
MKIGEIMGVLIFTPILIRIAYLLYKECVSLQWPHTMGTIKSSKVEQYYQRRRTYFRIKVLYTYQIGSQTFVSDKYRLHDHGSSLPWSYRNAERNLMEGSNVPVYYNPQNPSEAVLSPGFNWLIVATFIFLLLLFYQLAKQGGYIAI